MSDAFSAHPFPTVIGDLSAMGTVVRSTRKSQRLRIDDAASFNHVSVDLMSRLENGTAGVRLDKLLQVLDGLGLAMVIARKEQAQAMVQMLARAENARG